MSHANIILLRGKKEDLKINFPTPDFEFTVVLYRPLENSTLFRFICPFLVYLSISAFVQKQNSSHDETERGNNLIFFPDNF